jgi:hypothetical protein
MGSMPILPKYKVNEEKELDLLGNSFLDRWGGEVVPTD